jgi:hypothetical protein
MEDLCPINQTEQLQPKGQDPENCDAFALTAIVSEPPALAAAQSQHQHMHLRRQRSMLDYSSETRSKQMTPITIEIGNPTFSKNTTQQAKENFENQYENLQCIKNLSCSIDTIFAQAKSVVNLTDEKSLVENPQCSQVNKNEISPTHNLEIQHPVDSSGDSLKSDYVVLNEVMTDKNQIVGENSSESRQTDLKRRICL